MTTTRVKRPRPRSKARSPLGQFMSLEHAYWRGALTPDEAARWEDLHRYLRDLYSEARS